MKAFVDHLVRRLRALPRTPGKSAPTFATLVAEGDRARDSRNWPAAATCYKQAVQLQPHALGIFVQLGHALKESGQFADAEVAYRRFLAESAEDADIHLQMGHLFARQERFSDALPWYERALELAVDNRQIADDARRGLKEANGGPVLKRRRAVLGLTERRRFFDARNVLISLVEEEGCEDLTGILGNVFKELGEFDEAGRYYERYRAYAETAGNDILFDAELQLGHFEKVQRKYAAALGHFARADAVFADATLPSCTRDALNSEIRTCLSQITKAIRLV